MRFVCVCVNVSRNGYSMRTWLMCSNMRCVLRCYRNMMVGMMWTLFWCVCLCVCSVVHSQVRIMKDARQTSTKQSKRYQTIGQVTTDYDIKKYMNTCTSNRKHKKQAITTITNTHRLHVCSLSLLSDTIVNGDNWYACTHTHTQRTLCTHILLQRIVTSTTRVYIQTQTNTPYPLLCYVSQNNWPISGFPIWVGLSWSESFEIFWFWWGWRL